MRSPSFTAVLRDYRARMKPPDTPENKDKRKSADKQLIDRWILDDRREDVWHQLKDSITEIELIDAVRRARQAAGAKINRIYGVRWGQEEGQRYVGWAEWQRETKKELSRAIGPKTHPLAAAELWERAAGQARDEFGHLFDDEPEFTQKEGAKVTRVRMLFMKILVKKLAARLDGPFLDPVATLTEIAFPGPELSVIDVANALRATTKQMRSR
jgi:hypothetical protein